jgi:hypothetical protein
VEVAEERASLALPFREAEQIAVQRVGQISGASCRVDGIRGAIEDRPVLAHEVLPGAFVSIRTGARQGKVFEVQRFEVA